MNVISDADYPVPAIYENYTGPRTIVHLRPSRVDGWCQSIGTVPAYACTDLETCTVYLPDIRVGYSNYKSLLKHELAHCAGWPASHPKD